MGNKDLIIVPGSVSMRRLKGSLLKEKHTKYKEDLNKVDFEDPHS
jgi:hypothetical protein